MLFFLILGASALARGDGSSPDQALPEITVHAERPLLELPEESSEFRGEAIEIPRDGQSSLARILTRAPSIQVVQPGGEGTPPQFLIRGQDPIENRYFLEGIPLSDAEFDSGNVSLLPLGALARADVYPEGVPLFYGEDGLGGAVDFVLPGLSGHESPAITARTGSYGYWHVDGNAQAVVAVPVSLTLDYTQSNEDFVYYDDNGTPFNRSDDKLVTRANNRFQRFIALPRARLYGSADHTLELFSLDTYGDTQVPGPVDIPATADLKEVYSLSALIYHGWKRSHFPVDSRWYFRLDRQSLDNPSPQSQPGLPNSDSNAWSLGWRSVARPVLGNLPSEASLGLKWDHYAIQSSSLQGGAMGSFGDRYRVAAPVGVSTKLELGPLELAPALTAHGYYYGSGQGGVTSGYFLASPRLGLGADPAPWVHLRGTVGSYYRAPTLYELYGDPSGIAASPSLSPERSWKGDLGADVEVRRPVSWLRAARFSCTWSLSRASNLINYLQNSQTTKAAINIGDASIFAQDFAVELESHWGLTLRTALELLDGVNLSDIASQYGKTLPNRPAQKLESTLGFEWKRWTASYTLTFAGPSYWDLANQMQLSSTFEHDLTLGYNAGSLGRIGLEIRNLTDVITADSVLGNVQTIDNTTGYLGYPAPGRRIYLTWRTLL